VIDAEQTIRSARLGDRQALADLSRAVHGASDAHRRSLGVPAPTAETPRFSLSDLIPSWLPLRAPSVHLVAEVDGEIVGSCRAVEEPHRDDWVITELDAADGPMAAEVRFGLLGALIEEAQRNEVGRIHAACADVRENLELFGQTGFMAYAQEEIWWRAPQVVRGPRSWFRSIVSRDGRGAARAGTGLPELQPAGAPDAWHLFDLWTHTTPPAIARVEGYGVADWESVGQEAIVPRSALNPILHFGEVNAWLLPAEQRAGGFAQHGTCRGGPHYLRFLVREGVDGGQFLAAALERAGSDALAAGILAPVRTYESTGTRAARSASFEPIGRVTLLVREVRAQVRQPAMMPVATR
jgi:hypothetical protein